MLICTRSVGDTAIVDLHGRLGVECGATLREAVRELLLAGRGDIVLNLLAVTGVDAAGLGELASAFRLVCADRGELRLVVRSATIRELLLRTNLLGPLPTFSTEGEAISSFRETALSATASAMEL